MLWCCTHHHQLLMAALGWGFHRPGETALCALPLPWCKGRVWPPSPSPLGWTGQGIASLPHPKLCLLTPTHSNTENYTKCVLTGCQG